MQNLGFYILEAGEFVKENPSIVCIQRIPFW